MMQNRIISTVFVILLLAGIVAIRFFQQDLFYDPFDEYFHTNFQALPFPEVDLWKWMFSNSIRFLLNSSMSIGIIWFLYKSAAFVKAGLWVYGFAFIILTIAILILLQLDATLAKMALFYTRRFLIHPLLLFILVAGCYYLKSRKVQL
jgi:exosortase F-associated protein